MNCENYFCIYQSKGKCIIEENNIDNCGMCLDCIYPDIEERILTDAKNRMLEILSRENNT